MKLRFRDRTDAGRQLAKMLLSYANQPGVVVLALPRGGVPVGFEVAKALHAPLDIFVVRKLGVPGHTELAMGAIASGGVRVLNQEVIDLMGIPSRVIDEVTANELRELERREEAYREAGRVPDVRGKEVVLVDDGIATGSTVRAAVRALRQMQAARIIVATPTVAASTADELRQEVDELVSVMTPVYFQGVGEWYHDFSQTTDEEVRACLRKAGQLCDAGSP